MTRHSPSAPPFRFNLWDEPWIRVTHLDGRAQTLGIGTCLAQAHTLSALHDPSPLTVGGIHRMLTAIVQALSAPESPDAIASLLRDARIETARLDAFAAQHRDRFDLFHPTTPFLQTGDVSLDAWEKTPKGNLKSVVSLFAEIPGATNRIHFHHVTDDSHRVCPACCARGLITIPAFATSGGQGIRPSINGVPPVYVFPAGDTLFESLTLSLTAPGYQPQAADEHRANAALWNADPVVRRAEVVGSVSYLESLTFRARRMRLYPRAGHEHCTRCGAPSAITVRHMLYEMGHYRSDQAGIWDDPFVARRHASGKGGARAEPLPVQPLAGKVLWREYTTLLLATPETQELRPKIVQQIGRLVDRRVISDQQTVRFRCIGIRTDNAKMLEWIDESLEVPPRLLVDLDGALLVEDALNRAHAVEKILTATARRHYPCARGSTPQALLARMRAAFWEHLTLPFRTLIRHAADPDQHDQAERAWVDGLIRIGIAIFRDTTDQAGDRAAALRARVEAQAECRRRLYAKRKEWVGDN